MSTSSDTSVTTWIKGLKAGKEEAARQLWERFFGRLVDLARKKLGGAPRRISDEEDVALAALEALCSLGLDAEEIQDEILGHPDSEVVKQALTLFGSNLSSTRLVRLLSHPMWDVRLAAVDRLEADKGEEAKAALKNHMKKEPDDLVKRAIGRLLEQR